MKNLIMTLCIMATYLAGCQTFPVTINLPPGEPGAASKFETTILFYNTGNKEVPVDVLRGMLRDAQVQAQQSGTQGDQTK